jgi:xanthine dehydrogenase YagT iron-sulfur-binding subunit
MSNQNGRKNRPGLSRRQFLKGSGVTAAATALATGPVEALAGVRAKEAKALAPTGFGPGPITCVLNVNGIKVTTNVEPRVTLLDALRNYVDITGPKRVCDRGTCGACTCIVDGKPIYSCTMLALEAQGKKIETAESLSADGQLHKVAAAFVQYDAQQCGFCTPGFTTALKAALDKNSNATAAELEAAVAGNICRCGTYQQMRDAIRALASEKKGG